jgi:hypothetical protein
MTVYTATTDGSCCCTPPPTTCVLCPRATSINCLKLTVEGCACLAGVYHLPFYETYNTGGFPNHTIRKWMKNSVVHGYDLIDPCGTEGEMIWTVSYNQTTGCWFQSMAGVCGAGNDSNVSAQTPGIFGIQHSCDPLDVRWSWPYNASNPLLDNITCAGCGETVSTRIEEAGSCCCPDVDLPATMYAHLTGGTGGNACVNGTWPITLNPATGWWENDSLACGTYTYIRLKLKCVGGRFNTYQMVTEWGNPTNTGGGGAGDEDSTCVPFSYSGGPIHLDTSLGTAPSVTVLES